MNREENSDNYIKGLYDELSAMEEHDAINENDKLVVMVSAILADIAKSVARISDILDRGEKK